MNIFVDRCEAIVNNDFTIEELETLLYSITGNDKDFPVATIKIYCHPKFLTALLSDYFDNGWKFTNSNTFIMPNGLNVGVEPSLDHKENIIIINVHRYNSKVKELKNAIKTLCNEKKISQDDKNKLFNFIDNNI